MTPAHTRRGSRRYQYYTCVGAQQRGWHTCPSKSVPAGEIERFVVAQLRNAADGPEGEHGTNDVPTALHRFDRAWDSLAPPEQARLFHRLVARVDYDGMAQTVSITFHPADEQAPADECGAGQKENNV